MVGMLLHASNSLNRGTIPPVLNIMNPLSPLLFAISFQFYMRRFCALPTASAGGTSPHVLDTLNICSLVLLPLAS